MGEKKDERSILDKRKGERSGEGKGKRKGRQRASKLKKWRGGRIKAKRDQNMEFFVSHQGSAAVAHIYG